MSGQLPATEKPSLSVLEGVAIMVGVVIGIGIFRTPSLVASNVGSEAMFIGVWAIGGLITLIGALVYAELAAAHPNTGGEYHFLHRAYGRSLAVMFGWARGTVIQTGAIAAVAFVFGEYAAQLLPIGEQGANIYALGSVIVLTALNYLGTPQSKNAQMLLTGGTVLGLALVTVAGFSASAPAAVAAAPSAGGGALGLAFVFVMLTYGGWNEAAYLSAEIKDVRRNMVRVLLLGTGAIAAIYVLINAAYLSALGLEGLRGSNAPAADVMRIFAGEWGALVLSMIIAFCALSTLNGTIFTGARIYFAIGRDLPTLQRLGIWSERGHNPANAILLQGAIAFALVLFGALTRDGFQAMVDYTAPVFWFFMLLVTISLFILRRKEPGRELPFRVPLYPVTPALFALVCVYMLYSSLAYTGFGALIGIGVLAAGLPLILIDRGKRVAPAE